MKIPTLYFLILLTFLLSACTNIGESTKSSATPNNADATFPEHTQDATIVAPITTDEKSIDTPKALKVNETLPNVNQERTNESSNTKKEKTLLKAAEKQELPAPPDEEASTNKQPIDELESVNASMEAPKLQEAIKPKIKNEVSVFINHDQWDQLLRKYVSSDGKVNYASLKKEKDQLQGYLDLLSSNPPKSSWPRAERLAYWINVYNAFTVKLIVDNYPLSSITKLHGGKPWDAKWIEIGDKTYNLNAIENEIIRPQFNEPRIHFAVNCAAQSCPPLLNRAWTANNLELNFVKQTKAFINNPKYNSIQANAVQLSKIFDWYKQDFGELIDFLNKYANQKINSNAKVSFKEYDWALNN